MKYILSFMVVISLVIHPGCATTDVIKNPGPKDKGVRFYRPKPYLLIQPHQGNSVEFVSITTAYLPDYTEEYSIKAKAGLGWNKTAIKLENGWNLTELSQELDSQTDENIDAAANLISKFVKQSSGETDKENGSNREESLVVRSKNVPFGYYESVISRGPDGCKRLYGWRYVGFMPFNQCPVVSGGVECIPCESNTIYGLSLVDGAMAFVPLGDLALSCPVQYGKPNTQPQEDALTQFEKKAVNIVNEFGELHVDTVTAEPTSDPLQYTVIAIVSETELDRAQSKAALISQELTRLASQHFESAGVRVTMSFTTGR